MNNKKVAIVYDWIDTWGGVERVLLILTEIFPNATFFTSYVNLEKTPWAKDLSVRSSFIQRLPRFIKNSRILSVPFYPFAFESFDFSEFDLVISISSSFAKGIITRPETKHICYLLTPTRFLWLYNDLYTTFEVVNIAKTVQTHLKKWDMIASQRPDRIISISKTVQKRTKDIYNRDSEVIYPPFDIEYWERIKFEILNPKSQTNSKFFLVVSRLEPYKRVDLVLQLFNQLKHKNLVIVGTGSQEKKLKAMAGPNITFLKNLSDSELAALYSNAEALIMPQEEDFGLVALEAQFFGCPVIAYGRGGATETIIEGETGLFFEEQAPSSLQNTLEKYEKIAYTLKESAKKAGPKNIAQFTKSKFITKFKSSINSK